MQNTNVQLIGPPVAIRSAAAAIPCDCTMHYWAFAHIISVHLTLQIIFYTNQPIALKKSCKSVQAEGKLSPKYNYDAGWGQGSLE